MKVINVGSLAILLGAAVLSSCSDNSRFPGFEQSESGLYYMITPGSEGGREVKLDDILTLEMSYGTDDTMLFSSSMMEFPTQLKVAEPAYGGDIMEGFTLMKEGDEAEFKTSADSFFLKIANMPQIPDFVDSASFLTFNVKLIKVQSLDELRAEKDAEAEVNRAMETELMANFLKENGIEVEPTPSGLYFIETAPGTGEPVERGSMVKVHYIGRLLTGEKFDASFDHSPPEPIEFALGTGQVIPGWDEGIGYMTVGSKAMMVIPSSLAYGDRPPPGGLIKAYSPLVFEVELLEAN
ncbi:MAG: FKBP-type peptidyl-prolyl cis-trans isomerase [Vicingaceae bacterium]